MSADVRFTPKADINRDGWHVRYVPKADSCGAAIDASDPKGNAGSASSKKPSVPTDEKRTSKLFLKKEMVAERLSALHIKSMSEHKVTLKWERGGAEFSYQKYPRDHTWSFDGGHTMTASAAPAYLGNPANVDPEEAFVASLASCHMLTFLSIACKQKFVLDSYEDEAVGHMEKNADGKLAITQVELRPKITWSGNRRPSAEELDKMHHAAHENCFIANSVKTNVTVAER
jgi:organic hydroperoxide reductase OsmC/OhrA